LFDSFECNDNYQTSKSVLAVNFVTNC
jgi:hypothetical protein